MDLRKTEEITNKLLDKDWKIGGGIYNLRKCGWTFEGYKHSLDPIGRCNGKNKTISMSGVILKQLTEEDTNEVIIHELSHAIDFEIRGFSSHGNQWVITNVIMGGNPRQFMDLTKYKIYSNEYKTNRYCKSTTRS